MYEIRTVTLKNGDITKEVPVIDFKDLDKAILAEFLMSDSELLAEEIDGAIQEMDQGKRNSAEWFGNRCSVSIEGSTAVIKDLLEGFDKGMATYPPYKINVIELQRLMNMWLEVKKEYRHKR